MDDILSSGRFTGIFHHAHLQQDQLARLDFVTERVTPGEVRIRATLVLYFGDFTSDEYVSYYYDRVHHDSRTGTLVFDSPEREVHFVVENFTGDEIRASLRSGLGIVGQLTLTKNPDAIATRPLVQKLWGEYRGICHGIGQRLQIQSTPNHPIATNRSDPFAPFIIMAQVGDNGGRGCPFGTSTCVSRVYHDADYDIFTGHIDFHGLSGSMACDIDPTGMTCGNCRYERSSREAVDPGLKTLSVSSPVWDVRQKKQINGNETIQGVYKGFVHLERRDIYHPMSIAITTYQTTREPPNSPIASPDDAKIEMASVISSIRYGGHTDMDESINTKFDARSVSALKSGHAVIFDRGDGSTDTIIKIDRLVDGILSGSWYSRRFGFVGNFLLAAGDKVSVHPMDRDKADSKLTGRFGNGKFTVKMLVAMSDRAISSKDPFSPLTIQGHLWYHQLTTRKPFTDTAFDPFTGKFSLDTEGAGGAYIGTRNKNGIRIKIPNQGILRPMQSHEFVDLVEILDDVQ